MLRQLILNPLAPCPALTQPIRSSILAKPNYSFEKRQRELAKKKQKEEKKSRKQQTRDEKTGTPTPKPE